MLHSFATAAIFLLGGLALGVIALALNWLLRPKPRQSPNKLTVYECGPLTQGPTWVRFKMGYFLYALVFLVFDVETVFLYPWAVKFKAMGLFAFWEMVIFICILLLGWWYAVKEGAFEWK